MSISYQILGQPGRNNALFVEINTGQSIHRLQFDCGEACLWDLPAWRPGIKRPFSAPYR